MTDRDTRGNGPRTVAGRALDQDAMPVPGLTARLDVVRLRSSAATVETVTDEEGRYSLQADGPGPWRVSLLDPAGGEVATSGLLFADGDVLDVDDLVVGAVEEAPTEFDLGQREIEPLLGGVPLADVTPAELGLLNRSPALPAGVAADLVASARLHDRERRRGRASALPEAAWYAWRREGLPVEDPAFWDRPADDLLAAVATAAERGVVPASVLDGGGLGRQVRAVRAEHLLDRPVAGGATLRDLLATSPEPIGEAESQVVAETVTERRPGPDRLGTLLREANVPPTVADAAVRTVRLAELTGGRTPTVATLQAWAGGGTDLAGLAALAADDWLDLAYRHGAPDGETPQSYARRMTTQVETMHPTATLAARLANGSLQLPIRSGDRIAPFLEAHPDFDIANTPIAPALQALPEVERPPLAAALRTVRRIGAVTAGWDQVHALLERRIDSVERIAAMGPAAFATAVSGELDAAEAAIVVEQAQALQQTTAALVGTLRTASAQGVDVVGATIETSTDRHPSLRALFGPLDSCECGHCRSLLSPAAYLVDLLHFLERGAPAAFDALLAHRPDVVELDLSCANGEVTLPAVDLAVEVLENATALPFRVDLPAGTDALSALATDPLPDVVLAALSRTADDVSGSLRALREPLRDMGFAAYTVTDRDRRWTLHAQPESLTAAAPRFGTHELSGAGLDLERAVHDLDGGTLPPALDTRIRDSVPSAPWEAVVGTTTSASEPGRSWTVMYRLRIKVRSIEVAGENDVTLTLATDSGTPLLQRSYSTATVAATLAELRAGRLGGILPLLLPVPDEVRVDLGAGPDAFVTVLGLRFALTRTPGSLTVEALTYQSPTGRDLSAEPRNRNPRAYEILRDADFPWSLPLNEPEAETRALLDRAGVGRDRLLDVLLADGAFDSDLTARETIGLSPEQWERIATPRAGQNLWAAWGLSVDTSGSTALVDASTGQTATGTPESVLARVSILMQQAALTHREVLDVAGAGFVRGSAPAPIVVPFAECIPSRLHLEPVDAGFLDRFHRFARLRRTLDLPVGDVDAALAVFAPGGVIGSQTLRQLGHLVRLNEETAVPVAALLGWYRPGGAATAERATAVRQALHLGEADWTRALRLTGLDPLVTPAQARLLVRALDAMRRSGFTLRELCYLGRHRIDVASPADEPVFSETGLAMAPVDERIAAVLSDLRTAANAVRAGSELDTADPATVLAGLGWYPALVSWVLGELAADLTDPAAPVDPLEVQRRRARLARRLRHATLPRLTAQFDAAFDPAVTVPADLAGRVRLEPGDAPDRTRIRVDGWFDPADAAVLRPVLGAAGNAALGQLVAASDTWSHDDPDRLLTDAQLQRLHGRGSTLQTRLALVLAAVLRRQQVEAVAASLEQSLRYPAALIRIALIELLADPEDTSTPSRPAVDALLDAGVLAVDPRVPLSPARHPVPFAVIRRLAKVCAIADRTRLGELVRAFRGTGPGVAGRVGGASVLDLNALPCGLPGDAAVPLEGWLELVALTDLYGRRPGGAALAEAYLRAAAAPGSDAERRSAVLDLIADSTRQAPAQVAAAAAQVELCGVTVDRPRWSVLLLHLLEALDRLRATGDQARALVADGQDGVSAEAAARLARSLLRARYSDAAWDDVVRPVSDRLRGLRRDALVAHLLHRDRLPTADALYERYLIDPRPEPIVTTTRLLTTIEAVQLHIHRCLLGLEPSVPPGAVNRDQWEWMKAYRVWEAARKVFLRPQHWLRPELRADASDAFRALQSGLAQVEASEEGARAALLSYLDELTDLSQMTVLAVHEDDRTTPGRTDLYIVGRRANPPHRYHWRVCTDVGGVAQRWGPWQTVDLDVSGSHVVPFVLNGDFYLAWATFRRNQSRAPGGWEVQLAWARRTTSGWTEKKVAPDTAVVPALPGLDEHRTVVLRVSREERTDSNIPEVAGIPRAVFRLPVARIELLGAHDPAAVPTLSRSDVATSGVGAPGLTFTCQVLFEDADGARWPAAGVGLLLWWGIMPVAGLQTGGDGRAAQFFQPWPIPALQAIPFPRPQDANEIKVDAIINGTITESRTYPTATAFNRPVKRWDVQFVLAAPAGGTAPAAVVDPERSLLHRRRGAFEVYPDRDARYLPEPGTTAFEPVPVLGGEPYDSGFREDSAVSTPGNDGLGLRFQPGFRFQQVFAATPGRYQLVQGARDRNGYWHYQDDVTQCLIRLYDDGRMVVVADGQRLATRLRAIAGSSPADVFDPATQALSDGGRTLLTVNQPTAAWLITQAEAAVPQASALEQGLTFDRNNPGGDSAWETFFHLPLLVAQHLRQNQRYAEAQDWLRHVFDPTGPEARGAASFDARLYWRFRPFREADVPARIEELVALLANPNAAGPARTAFRNQVEQWRARPFEPHEIARTRTGAYQWQAVLAYLRNLLDWADDLFRRDTRESLVEALMLYVEAADLLGPRPGRSPSSFTSAPLSYRALRGRWDEFGDAWYTVADSPLLGSVLAYIAELRAKGVPNLPSPAQVIAQLSTIGVTYFCVPPDEVLEEYWDRLEDRLFKIRHSQNFDGVERQLPFFSPPIDPALLVEAAAAGIDIGQAVAQAGAPLSPYRFPVLLQVANDLCARVASLDATLLTAREKLDEERLALIHSDHESTLLTMMEQVRIEQVSEAEANLTALRATRESAAGRYRQLQQLLSGQPGTAPPEGFTVSEAPVSLPFASAAVDVQGVQGLGLTVPEQDRARQLGAVKDRLLAAEIAKLVAPVFYAAGSYPVTASLQGLGHAAKALSQVLLDFAGIAGAAANQADAIATYQRRRADWVAQSNAAQRELAQIDKQLAAATIRKGIADRELAHLRRQVSNAEAVDAFLRSKYSSADLFGYMTGQAAQLATSAYGMALDLARQAERAYQFELAQSETFIRPRHADPARGRLLAGEQLANDLKRLEVAYLNRRRREHELTHDVSLRQLDPLALTELRANGSCTFTVPEWLFDLRVPGLHLRRIKTVSLSLPCVAGPHTAVHARLTLLSSEVRRSPSTSAPYPRSGPDDPRFSDDLATAEAVVTSGTRDATGLWEPSLDGDRRMPGEGRGAISTWRLELPSEFPAVDFSTITDAVLRMRYSARDGGEQLRAAATDALRTAIGAATASPHALLISLRHDFPTQWSRLTTGAGSRTQELRIARDRLPYFVTSATAVTIARLDVLGAPAERSARPADLVFPRLNVGGDDVTLAAEAVNGALAHASGVDLALTVPTVPADSAAVWSVTARAEQLRAFADVVVVVTYSATIPAHERNG